MLIAAADNRRYALSARSGVHASENVRTGSSSQADLRFLENSNITVEPGSNVRLDKFVYDPNKGTGGVAIEASRGAFRFVTGSQNKGSYSIKTLPAPLAFAAEALFLTRAINVTIAK